MSPSPADMADLEALAGLAPELAATFASLGGDIALVIGPDGVIRNVALGDAPTARQANQWVGLPLIDTVTQDTRSKITQMLQEVGRTGISRRREVNLPGAGGADIPVAFAAIRLGNDGPVLAVGRDLRAIAAIQQRFVEAQQVLERDYWTRRQAESCYRLLFQVATDAVLMVDAATLTIVEANAAATELFGLAVDALVGQPATVGLAATARTAVDELLASTRASGRPAEMRARLGPQRGAGLVDLSATPFRAGADGGSAMLLLRARAAQARGGDGSRQLAEFVEQTPDAVVITDSIGRVLMANPAFQLMCLDGLAEHQLKGRLLIDLLGDPGHRLSGLVAEVRRNGIASQVRAPIGAAAGGRALEVEVSAALLADGDQECIGFTLRRLVLPRVLDLQPVDGLALVIENLVGQLGQVSLPELLLEATRLAERHLMRSALQRARGHSAAAAAWLGITPESLALRLQRHGLVTVCGRDAPPALLN